MAVAAVPQYIYAYGNEPAALCQAQTAEMPDALSGATDLGTPDQKYYKPKELIQVSLDSVVLKSNQTEAEVFVTARSAYELYCRSPWMTVAQKGGKLTIRAQPNDGFTPRTARIILTTKKENVSRVITVTQKAAPGHDLHLLLPTTANVYPMTEMDLSLATHDPWIKSVLKNRSVDGHAVKIKGNTYQCSVSTHAPSLFRVRLNGAERFVCDLGIDDEVLTRSDHTTYGNASYSITLDGRQAAAGNLLLTDTAAVHIDLDTHDAEQMEILFGTNGTNWGDHIDMGNPYFLLTKEKPVLKE